MRLDGIEPTTSVWKTEVLPLNYRRRVAKQRGAGRGVKPTLAGNFGRRWVKYHPNRFTNYC